MNRTALLAFGFASLFVATPASAADPTALDFFEKKVRPVLIGHCFACHSADTKPAGGLRVDDHNGLLAGGNSGPAVVPGKPADSLLLKRTGHDGGKRRMPLEGDPLTAEQIADLTTWVTNGAVWPAAKLPATVGGPNVEYDRLRKEHWSWQPRTDPTPPAVRDAAWPRDPVDRFVLAKLEANKLEPVGDADRVALVRRVTFDLTGLPPTPAEVDAFVADRSPTAFEKVVDRLLASPQFGERWGRHWLDVARYGESTGPSRNVPYPHAWKYRDWVIDAVNADKPFDRFVTEQVAGDLLPAATDAERDARKTATGFLALGVKDVNQRFKVRFDMDNVDEQVDAVSRSVLALTVSCARCHDHKFDPVSTADYYALAGIFTSTDNCAGVRNQMGGAGLAYYVPSMLVSVGKVTEPDAATLAKIEVARKSAEDAQAAFEAVRGTPAGLAPGPNGRPKQQALRQKWNRAQAEYNALTDPAARGLAVHGVRDAKAVGDTAVRIRGEAEKLGPVVPRGYLSAVPVPGAAPVNPQQSGRLELAAWLTSPANPLTARVAVNRVWAHLFGRGLVSTVDNFGVNGDTPTHPELLDHLANRFVRDGWSVKRLVRALVLTHAYQLSADATPAHKAVDPANKLVWRHTPRRLDAEEIRDAALQAAGTLDRSRPAGSAAKDLPMMELRDNGPEAKGIIEAADRSVKRSVYLPLLRGLTPRPLEAFDPVEQTLVTGTRDATTVPSQALFVVTSGFVRKQSLALADRLLTAADASDDDRARAAYRIVLGRTPTPAEVDRARRFVAEYASAYREDGAAATAADAEPADDANAPKAPVVDPDQADQSTVAIAEETVRPKDARAAAWLAFAQALFGSAEFRYLK